jgi:predicted O-methyltransferase YrrM
LLYAISNLQKPKNIIGIGSYFGYAMAWIVPNVDSNGKAYLIDPDKKASEICQLNFENMGLSERVNVLSEDFFDIVDDLPQSNLVWIDAYGSIDNSYNLRGKRIYGPIIEKVDIKIEESGTVIAHNVHNLLPLGILSKTGNFKPY